MPQFDNREEWEHKLQRELLQLTEPQIERLMRYLGNPPNINNVPDSFWRDLETDMDAVLEPAMESIYVESAQQLLTTVPRVLRVDWHLVNEPAAAWAEKYTFDLVKGITATSQQRLQTAVSGFYRVEGTTIGDVRNSLESLFGSKRADLIITTEVTRAAAEGEDGIVAEIEDGNPNIIMVPFWDTSNDELVCPICRPLNGQPLTGSNGGKKPPAHPRCRCGRRWEPRPRNGKPAPGGQTPKPEPSPPPTPPPQPPQPLPVEQSTPAPAAIEPTQTVAKPKGKPVSDALKLPKGKYGRVYQKVLNLINSIHGDGELKVIPVKTVRLGESVMGAFQRDYTVGAKITVTPISISISPKGDHIETTLAHEIGHFLDDFLGGDGFAFASETAANSSRPQPLSAWWKAVESSKAYQTLLDKYNNPDKYAQEVVYSSSGGTPIIVKIPPDTRHLKYLLTPRETWARSYAQYIATVGDSNDMLEQIAKERSDPRYGERQWEPEDFAVIAEAIDATLLEIGWTE